MLWCATACDNLTEDSSAEEQLLLCKTGAPAAAGYTSKQVQLKDTIEYIAYVCGFYG